MKTRSILLFLLFLQIVLSNLNAQRVDIEELKKNIRGNIHFVNYTGPEPFIQKREEILGIGKVLALRLLKNGREGKIDLKYSVYHIVGPRAEKGLDADIISIDKNSRVDHIKNVRRIIKGYLITAYGYSGADASSLAVFITLYNAVFRGNINYFQSRYKEEVLKYLDKENAGISLKYYEWPGKTRLVIPLTPEAGRGEISSVSTGEVSVKPVMKAARNNEGKELEARRGLVSIKEREVEEKKAKIAEVERKIKESEEGKAVLEKRIEKEERELEEIKKEGNVSNAELEEREKEIEALKEEKKRKGKEIAKLKNESSALKAEVTKKEGEIKEERKTIAEDQSKLKGQEKMGIAVEEKEVVSRGEPLYFLYGELGNGGMYRLVVMNFKDMKIDKGSDIKMIVDRDIAFWDGGLLVKAFDRSSALEREKGLVSIFLLNSKTLATEVSSKPIVWQGSRMLGFRDRLYAVGIVGGKFKLIAFDSKLNPVIFSEINVERDSYFCSYNNFIIIQDSKGKIRLLNPNTLKLVAPTHN